MLGFFVGVAYTPNKFHKPEFLHVRLSSLGFILNTSVQPHAIHQSLQALTLKPLGGCKWLLGELELEGFLFGPLTEVSSG